MVIDDARGGSVLEAIGGAGRQSMERKLAGKVAVVTGSGQGIGRAIAQRFAREGAQTIVATRTPEHGEATVALIGEAGGSAKFCHLDVADRVAVQQAVDETARQFGRLDIVVHNAAAFSRDPVDEMDDAALDLLLTVNLKACFTLTRAAVPHMRRQGGGRILITSSVTGPHVAIPGSAHYAASKGGVNGFIRTAALELAASGITVNGVEPGFIDTAALDRLKARFGEANLAKYIPAKRLGRPDEIASAMLFLASDEASYITGQTIIVDGGAILPESPLFVT
jgi:3-oxoacyl-[acyl-carrier protein] reductase